VRLWPSVVSGILFPVLSAGVRSMRMGRVFQTHEGSQKANPSLGVALGLKGLCTLLVSSRLAVRAVSYS
jgi:site-specific recombinase